MKFYRLIPFILILIFSLNICKAQKSNEWKKIKQELTPKKKTNQHMIKGEKDQFSNLREKSTLEFEEEKKKIISENKKLFVEKLKILKKSNLEKDREENEKYFQTLQSGNKANIKFWLQAQRYKNLVEDYLKYL